MTSQLILMNGFGVALASDSAMTFGENRTYETAEKVMPLPAPHPIAVLHSGAVNVHGMPYSVLVNEWATSLGSTRLRTVALYRQNFLSWLSDNHDWVSPKRSTDDFIGQLEALYRDVWDEIKKAVEGLDSSENSTQRCLQIWQEKAAMLSKWPLLAHDEGDWTSSTYQALKGRIDERREYWFDDIPMSDAINEQIDLVTRLYLERGHHLQRSELAFVGYGEKQLLPSYALVEISGFVNDSLLYKMTREQTAPDLESGNFFAICPIGQSDAIDRFLLGVDYSTVDVATGAAMDVLIKYEHGLDDDDEVDRSKPLTEDEVAIGDKIYSAIESAFRTWSFKNFKQPLFGAIAALPPASLATAARSLIEIQSLSQTITGEMGTVGGPIDVAVISRESSFQWVSHKSMSLS